MKIDCQLTRSRARFAAITAALLGVAMIFTTLLAPPTQADPAPLPLDASAIPVPPAADVVIQLPLGHLPPPPMCHHVAGSALRTALGAVYATVTENNCDTTPDTWAPPPPPPPPAPEEPPAPADVPFETVVNGNAADLLAHPHIDIYEAGRRDLENGEIDERVIVYLQWLLSKGYSLEVNCLKTGHSKFVAGKGSISNHYFGRAVDIRAVNGEHLHAGNDIARQVAQETVEEFDGDKPSELGFPWYNLTGLRNGIKCFANSGHQNHLHIGWRGND